MDIRLRSENSPKGGRGLFAASAIPRHTLIYVQGGRVMPVTEEESDDPLQISGDLVIGPLAVEIDASDKINHSCDPNLGIVGQTFFVTLREIQAGEEVCFDYAMCLSPAPGVLPYQMECHCGSSRCRGIITDTDWTNPKLRANYQGSNSWYLEEKIKLLEKHE